ncbi:MAG: amidohydrolase family protein [Candidatus Syntropharchaeia archaeon]
MTEFNLSGEIICGDNFEVLEGYVTIKDGIIHEIGTEKVDSIASGIIIPSFINAHTHIGDSVVKDVDFMPLEKLVGPGGLKEKILKETGIEEKISAMRDSVWEILLTGTSMFVDFREEGILGVRALKKAVEEVPIHVRIFGRPSSNDFEELLSEVCGIGMSGVYDHPFDYLREVAECTKKRGLMFAIHAGERDRGDIKKAIELEPDYLVHLTNASIEDLRLLRRKDIPVVVCPRSNFVTSAGMPPISKMIEEGIVVGVGTDNIMLNSPNMFSEAEFISKIFLRDDRRVLEMCTLNGARILGEDDERGSIVPGKVAELFVINKETLNLRGIKNPISGVVRRGRPEDIEAIVTCGNIIYRESIKKFIYCK